MSKGSKRRPENGTQYQDNWERIFGNKKKTELEKEFEKYKKVNYKKYK